METLNLGMTQDKFNFSLYPVVREKTEFRKVFPFKAVMTFEDTSPVSFYVGYPVPWNKDSLQIGGRDFAEIFDRRSVRIFDNPAIEPVTDSRYILKPALTEAVFQQFSKGDLPFPFNDNIEKGMLPEIFRADRSHLRTAENYFHIRIKCLENPCGIQYLLYIPAVTGKTNNIGFALREIIDNLLHIESGSIEIKNLDISMLPDKRIFQAVCLEIPEGQRKMISPVIGNENDLLFSHRVL
jgi:hypothetical protein